MSEPAIRLPYAHLNLRHNPFGELTAAARAELAVVEVDSLVTRLEKPGFAVQFIGDCGRGKTTHILAILRHFPAAKYVHVGEGETPRFGPSDPLVIDEIQRVPPRQRRRLFRRGVSLVIGTHEDVENELRQAGLDVETVAVAQRMDPPALQRILNRRIEGARRNPGALPRIRLATAQAMMRQWGDNVRAIEGSLYETFQKLREIKDV